MTDLNSQLNYSSHLHYQQQQQLQSHLQKLQSNIKTGQDKIVPSNNGNNHNNANNDPNSVLLNIPLDQQQAQQMQQGQANQAAAQHQAQIFNNNGLFSDTLSPFFAPYGIDVSHFPLTNPPIFDSALMMNNQGQPRRRISISNGQIGQITTHALNGDDLYDSQPPPLPKPTSQDDSNINPQQHLYNPSMLDAIPSNVQAPPPQQAPQQLVNVPQQQQPATVPAPAPAPPQQQIPRPQTQGPPPPVPQQHVPHHIKHESPFPTQGPTGIPSHKLVYNNEVIFNPDAGPIPGTAAWKKARLLERNRIAASKCRQRKKAAHIQLKEDVEKYQFQINQLKKDKKQLLDFYKTVKGLYEGGANVDVEKLGDLLKSVSVIEDRAFDDDHDVIGAGNDNDDGDDYDDGDEDDY